MKKIYTSRKLLIIRYIISVIISIFSVFLGSDNDFRAFMLILAVAISGVMAITIFFWRGLDKGKFKSFYTEENLDKRNTVILYCSIFIFYGTITTAFLGIIGDNFISAVLTGILVLLLVFESVFFSRFHK